MPQYIHFGPPVFLNAAKTQIVPGDSVEAAWLLVGTGGALSAEEARQWGLVGAAAALPDDAKARSAPANKKKIVTEDK